MLQGVYHCPLVQGHQPPALPAGRKGGYTSKTLQGLISLDRLLKVLRLNKAGDLGCDSIIYVFVGVAISPLVSSAETPPCPKRVCLYPTTVVGSSGRPEVQPRPIGQASPPYHVCPAQAVHSMCDACLLSEHDAQVEAGVVDAGAVGGGVPPPTRLTIADHYTVSKHLEPLLNQDLISLGLALGLHYPHLCNMSRPLLNELVAAWLNGEDSVLLTTGDPSWASLVKALRDIDQPGIADKVRVFFL